MTGASVTIYSTLHKPEVVSLSDWKNLMYMISPASRRLDDLEQYLPNKTLSLAIDTDGTSFVISAKVDGMIEVVVWNGLVWSPIYSDDLYYGCGLNPDFEPVAPVIAKFFQNVADAWFKICDDRAKVAKIEQIESERNYRDAVSKYLQLLKENENV